MKRTVMILVEVDTEEIPDWKDRVEYHIVEDTKTLLESKNIDIFTFKEDSVFESIADELCWQRKISWNLEDILDNWKEL